ncbi:MAG: protein-disulfide reductase DsbD domain-containing protein [Terriglobales bacterium]
MAFSKRHSIVPLPGCVLTVMALALLLGLLAFAQAPGVAHLTAPEAVTARAHSRVTANFQIAIQPGFHIQSNHPKLNYLIPSRIALAPAAGVSMVKVAWPHPKPHTFGFAPNQPLAVFEGTFTVPVVLKTGAAGKATLHGTFHYQACNDQLCRAPVTVPFTLTVHVH